MQRLPGNSNTYVERTNDLLPSVVASRVRFVPRSPHPRTVCMRVEVYGCPFDRDREPTAYQAPQGDEFAPRLGILNYFVGHGDFICMKIFIL